MDWKHPSIIAVTGPPFTGKSTIALSLASAIRYCILLSLDHIFDSVSPCCYNPTSPPPPHEAEQLSLQAFNILCRMVEKQLRLGVSVVLDSSFSSRTQLDQLVSLSTSLKATKIVIVKCEIKAKYAWQRRFESKGVFQEVDPLPLVHHWPDRWFKPRSWEDVTKLMNGYDTRLDEPIPGVSRVKVNVDKQQEGRSIIQAVQCLIFCEDDRSVDLAKFWEFNVAWTRANDFKLEISHDGEASASASSKYKGEKELLGFGKHRQLKDRFCSNGHYIAIFEAQGLDYEANCGACEEPVLDAAYTCNSCQYAIHKSCAELEVHKRSYTPHKIPSFILETAADDEDEDDQRPVYSFPESHACLVCREAGHGYNSKCKSCVFESLVRCRLIPIVIDHDCHQHKLSLGVGRTTRGVPSSPLYRCTACGLDGNYFFYLCTGCGERFYHVECVLLPYPLMHKHGGYKHLMELMFSRDKELEDYPCDFCLDMMNPEDWYYCCPQCPQTYHLRCAFEEDP